MKSFDELVLSHIGRLTPRLAHEIHSLVINDWGEISLRQVQRSIARLLKSGLIRIEGSGRGSDRRYLMSNVNWTSSRSPAMMPS